MKKMLPGLLGLALFLPACGGGSSPTAPSTPIFTMTGSGDTVFDLPSRITRIRIQATFTGFTSNFIVKIAGSLVVNELLGTGWGKTTFDGTYLIAAAAVTRVYDRSQRLGERRAALSAWAAWLEALKTDQTPGQVLPFRSR